VAKVPTVYPLCGLKGGQTAIASSSITHRPPPPRGEIAALGRGPLDDIPDSGMPLTRDRIPLQQESRVIAYCNITPQSSRISPVSIPVVTDWLCMPVDHKASFD
jgi:hypothetical protein